MSEAEADTYSDIDSEFEAEQLELDGPPTWEQFLENTEEGEEGEGDEATIHTPPRTGPPPRTPDYPPPPRSSEFVFTHKSPTTAALQSAFKQSLSEARPRSPDGKPFISSLRSSLGDTVVYSESEPKTSPLPPTSYQYFERSVTPPLPPVGDDERPAQTSVGLGPKFIFGRPPKEGIPPEEFDKLKIERRALMAELAILKSRSMALSEHKSLVSAKSNASVSYSRQVELAYELAEDIAKSVLLAAHRQDDIREYGSVVVFTFQRPGQGQITHYSGRGQDPTRDGVPISLLVEGALRGKTKGTVGGSETVLDILNKLFETRNIRFEIRKSSNWHTGYQIIAIIDELAHIRYMRRIKAAKPIAASTAESAVKVSKETKPKAKAQSLKESYTEWSPPGAPLVKAKIKAKAQKVQKVQAKELPKAKAKPKVQAPVQAPAQLPAITQPPTEAELRRQRLLEGLMRIRQQQGGSSSGSSGRGGVLRHCSSCGCPGANHTTCPHNPNTINPKPHKHY